MFFESGKQFILDIAVVLYQLKSPPEKAAPKIDSTESIIENSPSSQVRSCNRWPYDRGDETRPDRISTCRSSESPMHYHIRVPSVISDVSSLSLLNFQQSSAYDGPEESDLLRSGRVSSVTNPLGIREIRMKPVTNTIMNKNSISSERLVKIISKRNPAILQGKRVYVPSFGHGCVITVIKRFGRSTLFLVDFDKMGLELLKLSRKDGQAGEFFFVCDIEQ